MTQIIKNGKVDDRSVANFVHNANINQSIIELNSMWGTNGRYGGFSMITYMNMMDRHGMEWYGTKTYRFLDALKRKSWSDFTPEIRDAAAYMIIAALRCPEIGYDIDAKTFIDLRLEGESSRIQQKGLPSPTSDVEDIEDVPTSHIQRFKNTIMTIFRRKK